MKSRYIFFLVRGLPSKVGDPCGYDGMGNSSPEDVGDATPQICESCLSASSYRSAPTDYKTEDLVFLARCTSVASLPDDLHKLPLRSLAASICPFERLSTSELRKYIFEASIRLSIDGLRISLRTSKTAGIVIFIYRLLTTHYEISRIHTFLNVHFRVKSQELDCSSYRSCN